jgi:hypothetical protein
MEDNKKLPPPKPRNQPTTPLSAADQVDTEFTKADFENALRKVSRTIATQE